MLSILFKSTSSESSAGNSSEIFLIKTMSYSFLGLHEDKPLRTSL